MEVDLTFLQTKEKIIIEIEKLGHMIVLKYDKERKGRVLKKGIKNTENQIKEIVKKHLHNIEFELNEVI